MADTKSTIFHLAWTWNLRQLKKTTSNWLLIFLAFLKIIYLLICNFRQCRFLPLFSWTKKQASHFESNHGGRRRQDPKFYSLVISSFLVPFSSWFVYLKWHRSDWTITKKRALFNLYLRSIKVLRHTLNRLSELDSTQDLITPHGFLLPPLRKPRHWNFV